MKIHLFKSNLDWDYFVIKSAPLDWYLGERFFGLTQFSHLNNFIKRFKGYKIAVCGRSEIRSTCIVTTQKDQVTCLSCLKKIS